MDQILAHVSSVSFLSSFIILTSNEHYAQGYISFNLNQIVCCDHSLKSSHRNDSNEWSQHTIWLRNIKLSI